MDRVTPDRVTADGPIVCPHKRVDDAWIDYNGHMNMAYYSLVFDQALDYVLDQIGIGADYARDAAKSLFAAEVHVTYLQEMALGAPMEVTFQLLDWDTKRLHFFEQMYHAEERYLAATSEQLSLHVDMNTRRTTPFPQPIQQQLADLARAHAGIPRPEQAGHVIGIRR